ncbi:SDR family oxidoreductase [Candidatus Lokiarchaeum ossiferum]|uniref:SDR family oxidoreductase n=1 Tax=Candidatus Lokiarchaeum ossiferum TaxID=2951803 RepID=UPI00352F86C5
MKLTKLIERQQFQGKIAIICGGSKGIGKETAKYLVQMGVSTCLIARNQEELSKTIQECHSLKKTEDQFITSIACDTTDKNKLEPLLNQFISEHGVPDYLINTVGYAYPKYIQNLTLSDFQQNMHINYEGVLVPILILLPYFMKLKKGHIISTSSMMGYFGIMGYATYSPTKFAIVGLSEVLRHELKPYNINVSILYPPDTETPGFEKENEIKPRECLILSENAKLLSAAKVAENLIVGIVKNKFQILPGEAKLYNFLYRLIPKIFRKLSDNEYRQAIKKAKKK